MPGSSAAAAAALHRHGADTPTFFPPPSAPTHKILASKLAAVTTSAELQSTNTPITDTTETATPSEPSTLLSPDSTIHIELTPLPLSVSFATSFTRSPTAGATVLFLGTTRSYFLDPSRPVSRLSYSAYVPLALRTLLKIATEVQTKHSLEKVCVIHRLGEVAVAEESIVIAVSSAHRGAGWTGAEELLERVKERAEIWKREWFVDGSVEEGKDGEQGTEIGEWRDNRDSDRTGKRRDEAKDGN